MGNAPKGKPPSKKHVPLDLLGKLKFIEAWNCVDPPLTRTALRVAISLAQHQNPKTGRCDPSEEYLASMLGVTDRSIRSAVAELRRRGAFNVTKSANGGNFYLLLMPPESHLSPARNDRKSASNEQEEGFRPDRKQPSSKKIKKKQRKNGSEGASKSFDRNGDRAANKPRKNETISEARLEQSAVEVFGGGEAGWNALMSIDSAILDDAKSEYLSQALDLDAALSMLVPHARVPRPR